MVGALGSFVAIAMAHRAFAILGSTARIMWGCPQAERHLIHFFVICPCCPLPAASRQAGTTAVPWSIRSLKRKQCPGRCQEAFVRPSHGGTTQWILKSNGFLGWQKFKVFEYNHMVWQLHVVPSHGRYRPAHQGVEGAQFPWPSEALPQLLGSSPGFCWLHAVQIQSA